MLDLRWRQTVARSPHAWALRDAATGRVWTFAGLEAEADSVRIDDGSGLVFPSGQSVGFILELLRAWRAGRPVCPLEPGQAPPAVPPPPPGIAHLKLTSGTTGAPRCVAFTAAQLAADADAIVATMGLSPEQPDLGVISLAHSYGFSNLVLPLLLHGIPMVLVPSPLPAAVAEAARSLGDVPLALPAVPAMWRAWHEAGAIPRTVRLAIAAGAPLPLALEHDVFADRGLKLHNFLGASECGGIAYDAGETPRTDAAAAGHPMRGVELGRDEDGCLVVRGPAVGDGYWPSRDERLAGGVYRTQDRAEFDATGGVLLRGRVGDLVNVAGRKVEPEAVEAELRRHPAVGECLVFGVPEAGGRGESLVAVIELRTPATEQELRAHLLGRLPAWQTPRAWRFVPSLAPSQRGKLSRAEWRRRWMDGDASAVQAG
jgi:acyl-CoA synthetase (AMP-forming)/AMP-acid ligase II